MRSHLRAHCSSNLIKKIIFYYFSHLSHCTLLSFSLTSVTSLIPSFLFSHFFSLFFFLSLFFIHRHPQLKTMVVVVRQNCEEDEVEFMVCGSLLLIGVAGLRWFGEHGWVSTGVAGFGWVLWFDFGWEISKIYSF